MATKRQSLGKGLDALLGLPEDVGRVADDNDAVVDGTLREIPVELLQRGKYQPRRDFNSESLQELADSIANQGLIQPIVVRSVGQGRYEIIAGERRWRAAQLAAVDCIPAIVRDLSDQGSIAVALIENIQREDLNPIEESQALIRLQNEFDLTQQQVAQAVGKSRTAVTNLMRLASLEMPVQQQVERGDIELGHAKCLLALEGATQIQAARTVASHSMTVRQTEALVKKLQSPAATTQKQPAKNQDISNLQEQLSEKLGAAVRIQHNTKGSGKLTINYNSVDELDGILNHIK
ncbi:MAG: ParB/RepB/Spo0J family partition protein [Porticoccaceae bacterium]|nr:ParB/RepB/Spo0J family partition protein [Porticoccaceae bacterium]